MACYKPLTAYRDEAGAVSFSSSQGEAINLPCGRCVGCRLERSRQWATRIMHEASLHDSSLFLTLTYRDECLPGEGLRYKDVQLFLKRLRKRHKCRFFVAGEYGGQTGRAHWHMIVFGVPPFSDSVPLRKELFESAELNALWQKGSVGIGQVTFQSASYVARYVMDKITGEAAKGHYAQVDPETGEVVGQRVAEFCRMSLRPGIGARWFERFGREVFPSDSVVINGKEYIPPRYYEKLYKRSFSSRHEGAVAIGELKAGREFRAYPGRADNSQERLQVKEAVATARLVSYRRKGV